MEYPCVMSTTKAKTKNNSNKQTKTQDSVGKLTVYRIQIALVTQLQCCIRSHTSKVTQETTTNFLLAILPNSQLTIQPSIGTLWFPSLSKIWKLLWALLHSDEENRKGQPRPGWRGQAWISFETVLRNLCFVNKSNKHFNDCFFISCIKLFLFKAKIWSGDTTFHSAPHTYLHKLFCEEGEKALFLKSIVLLFGRLTVFTKAIP